MLLISVFLLTNKYNLFYRLSVNVASSSNKRQRSIKPTSLLKDVLNSTVSLSQDLIISSIGILVGDW